MELHIYANASNGRIWAINDLGTEVVFGGESKGMQSRPVNYQDWTVVARKKVAEGYSEIMYGLELSDKFTAKEAVLVVRSLHHARATSLSLLFEDDAVVDGVCSAIVALSAFATDGEIAVGARKWLDVRKASGLVAPVVAPAILPSITLAAGRGCYF